MDALCCIHDITDGHARGFDPLKEGRDTMFLVRRGSTLHAWHNSCPHIPGSPLAWKKDAYLNAERSRIVCSGHGAQFDIVSGVCLIGACEGLCLRPVRVAIDVRGCVAIDDLNVQTPGWRLP